MSRCNSIFFKFEPFHELRLGFAENDTQIMEKFGRLVNSQITKTIGDRGQRAAFHMTFFKSILYHGQWESFAVFWLSQKLEQKSKFIKAIEVIG